MCTLLELSLVADGKFEKQKEKNYAFEHNKIYPQVERKEINIQTLNTENVKVTDRLHAIIATEQSK